jgi:hypothetical protein
VQVLETEKQQFVEKVKQYEKEIAGFKVLNGVKLHKLTSSNFRKK